MLLLSLSVSESGGSIWSKQRYGEALQEMKHYLSVQTSTTILEDEYLLRIKREGSELTVVKNPAYLHSHHIVAASLETLDVFYECLLILQEYFPSSISLCCTGPQKDQLSLLQSHKKEEFNRRANSNCRSLLDSLSTPADIREVLHYTVHEYTKRNRILALKHLSKLEESLLHSLSQSDIAAIHKLSCYPELKSHCSVLLQMAQKDSFRQSRQSRYGTDLQLNTILFQLKESSNLQRICQLITLLSQANNILPEEAQKVEDSIIRVADKFVRSQYPAEQQYGTQLVQAVSLFCRARAKPALTATLTAALTHSHKAASPTSVHDNAELIK